MCDAPSCGLRPFRIHTLLAVIVSPKVTDCKASTFVDTLKVDAAKGRLGVDGETVSQRGQHGVKPITTLISDTRCSLDCGERSRQPTRSARSQPITTLISDKRCSLDCGD
jgi:hypothetical protein